MVNLESLSEDQINELVAKKIAMRIPETAQADSLESMSEDEINNLVAQKVKRQSGQDRPGQAALAGFGNAASFGYLPQLQAGVEKGVDYLFSDNTDEKLRSQGFDVAPDPSYVETRDQYIKDNQSLQESNPYASIAGGVVGGIASGIATGGALGLGAKTATMGARLGAAAKTGAVIGAVRNPSDKEGEIDPVQFLDRVKNASFDAATGIILQGGMETIGKAANIIKNSSKTLKSWSQVQSFKAAGPIKSEFNKAFKGKKVAELGQTMIDKKIIAMGDDITDIAKKAEIIKAETGNKIGKIYEGVDDALDAIDPIKLTPEQTRSLVTSEIDLGNFANAYKANLIKRFKGLSGSSTIVARISKELDDIAVNGKVSLKKLQEVRRSIDEQINFSKSTQELKGVQEELLNMRNKLQDIAKQRILAVDKINGTSMARDLGRANKDYSNLSDISRVAQSKMAGDASNAAFGLRERMSGGTGAVVGGMMAGAPGAAIGGITGAITTKAARAYGSPMIAIASNRVARALENNKALLGKFSDPILKAATSPKEFVTAVELMMKDPEFKAKVQKINLNDFKTRELASGKN